MGLFVLLGKGSRTGLLPLYLRVPCGEDTPSAGKHDAVLQWGIPVRDPEAAYVLNPVKCLLRAKHAKSVREIWRLNGLKTAEDGEWVHEYRIPVFQQEALGVWVKSRNPVLAAAQPGAWLPKQVIDKGKRPQPRHSRWSAAVKDGGIFQEIPAEDQMSFHIRRAKRDAVRAVYALGLATGCVRVGIDREGSTVVLEADPAPPLDERLAEVFAEAINRYGAEREAAERLEEALAGGERLSAAGSSSRNVLLGADPEFVLRRPDGHFVSASRYLEKEGRVGCDAVVLSRSRVIHPLAELRPKPSVDPRELVRELHRTMRQAAKLITDSSLAWLSGSMPAKGLPIGGHVHVSGIWVNERLLRALDNYVALPLLLAEGEAAGLRRPRYGFLGDCRRKRHGGFEYRTLPSWLASPELALSVLALVRTVVLHYRELPQTPLNRADVQRAYYSGDKNELLPVVKGLWTDLEPLPVYREFKKELDACRDRLFRLEGWDEQADFRIPWKIPPFHEKGATFRPFML
jgi:hypothetical protein